MARARHLSWIMGRNQDRRSQVPDVAKCHSSVDSLPVHVFDVGAESCWECSVVHSWVRHKRHTREPGSGGFPVCLRSLQNVMLWTQAPSFLLTLKSSFLTSGGTSWWCHVISILVFMNSKVKSLSFQSRFLAFLFPGQFFFLMDCKKPRIHSYLFLNLFFNGKIIVLQNFVVFCQASAWVSHRYKHVPSLLNLPPISLPIPPL